MGYLCARTVSIRRETPAQLSWMTWLRGRILPPRDRFRTALGRAATAAGVPTFSPHDLRHRQISLMHLAGTPWARIGEHVGQRNLAVTGNTYTHVLADETELDYTDLLHRDK